MEFLDHLKVNSLVTEILKKAKEDIEFGSIKVEFFIQNGKITMVEIVEKKEKKKFV